jgi:SAM-dependent methyltransferase
LAWPESECVGIDLDAQTIANAEEKRQQLGVKNVSLYALGLDSLVNIEAGTFDYIIINGIFSLLPETERAVLLAFASRSLTPNGIVAMRWNSLPGSRDAKSIQDAIALHTADATDDEMTLNSARAMIIYLEMVQQPGRINSVLSSAAASSDNEFLLRYLHNFNDAVYLADFNQMLVECEFQYVGIFFRKVNVPRTTVKMLTRFTKPLCQVKEGIGAAIS